MFDNSSIYFPNIRKISQKPSHFFYVLNLLLLLILNNSLISNETIDTVARMKKEDFRYADSYRYTVTGKLPPLETNLKASTYIYTGAAVGALFVGQHIAQSRTIWDEKTSFRIIEDGAYGLYVDNAGHFVSSYLSCYALGEAMFAAGLSEKRAKLFGALLGFAYISYIEVMDGYGVNFGFSPTDFYFNTLGSGFYLLQSYFPYLENITPKFQIINSELFGYEKRIPHSFFVDDYASQVFFLSFNVHNMLPENLKKYWLPWLEISVGYTARNQTNIYERNDHVDRSKSPNWGVKDENGQTVYLGEPRFIIALDYNLTKLIPESKYNFINWTVQSLNYFKMPSPAVEFDINGKARFVLLYPFLAF